MQTRSGDENSVRPSVCPAVRLSVTRVDCGKTVGRSVQIYIPYERTFSLVSEKKNGWWGRTLLREILILGQPTPVGEKAPGFNRYSPV